MEYKIKTVQPPKAPIVKSAAGGTLPAGKYKYVCTFIGGAKVYDWNSVPVQAEETKIGAPTEWVANGSSKGEVMRPVIIPTEAVGWKVYRSKIGGEIDPVVKFVRYYEVSGVLPITQESFLDNASDSGFINDAGELSSTFGNRLYIDDNLAAVNGTYNTGYGLYVLQKNTTGQFNSGFGRGCLNQNSTGKFNTGNGCDSLKACISGNWNVANGVDALQALKKGNNNTATGHSAGNLTDGDANCLYGQGAGALGAKTIGECAYGMTSLLYSQGKFNSAYGHLSGRSITGGDDNVFSGHNSGFNPLQKQVVKNSIAIGAYTYTTKDNQVVIGDNNITETLLKGNVGLGCEPDASALLDLSSTTKVLKLMSMSKEQRNALVGVKKGSMIYQNDEENEGLRVFNGTNWVGYTEIID